jgi:hypothetical protein
MIEQIGKIAIILPAVITFMGLLGNITYNFLIETIKYKYKRVPGQQSGAGIIFNVFKSLIIIIYICIIVLSIIGIIISLKHGQLIENLTHKNFNNDTDKNLMNKIIVIIGAIAIYFMYSFFSFRDSYKNKLKGYKVKKVNKIKSILNLLILFVSGILIVLLLVFEGQLISSNIEIIFKNGIVYKNNLDIIDYKSIFFVFIIGLLTSIVFMISLSLKEIINTINEEKIYSFFTSNDIILCKCYLEFKDYYLIIEKDIERYIKKECVIEVRKVNSKLDKGNNLKVLVENIIKKVKRKFVEEIKIDNQKHQATAD